MARKDNIAQAHEGFLVFRKKFYLKVSLLLCLASLILYFATDFTPARNGGTWVGYTLGTVGALLILWLSMLGIRKRWITQGHWSLKRWTSAHVYLGLSLIFIATLHTGFQFGWNVHTLAYTLMAVVIISGIFGIYFYAVVPARMSKNRAQMSQVGMLEALSDLNAQLTDAAQPLDDSYIQTVQNSVNNTKLGGHFLRRLSGKDKNCPTLKALEFFRAELQTAANEDHGELLGVIAILEQKNALLVRIRRHIRHKALMGGWLFLHIPLTFALLAALSAHIISVFFYS